MKKRNVTNKDIMKRLDALENRNASMSVILLLYSLAITFVIGYFSTKEISFILSGAVCYVFGGLLSYMNKTKKIKYLN